MPTATAAGSAVVSDDEVNSRKYAAAVAVRLAVSRMRGWTRSRSRRMTGAPSRKPAPRQDSRNPVCSLPPSRWTPKRDEHGAERGVGGQEDDRDGKQRPGDGLAAQDAHALDEVAGHVADRGLAVRGACGPAVEVMNMAAADSR